MMLEILEFILPVCYVQSSLAIYLRFVNVLADWLTGWLAGWLSCLLFCLRCQAPILLLLCLFIPLSPCLLHMLIPFVLSCLDVPPFSSAHPSPDDARNKGRA
jgi:hypothetical protein